MEENGNMEWNENFYYLKEQAESFLKEKLGLIQFDYWKGRSELYPYYYYIVQYINTEIVNLDTEDFRTIIKKIFEIFKWGGDLIVEEKASTELSEALGLLVPGELESNTEHLCFCWGDFMSTLCLRLKFQYAYLFAQEPDGECCTCGARGQTESEFESWNSGVYPGDECYDRTNYYRTNSAWGLEKDQFCECANKPIKAEEIEDPISLFNGG
jgi:hypothetical protein